MAKQSLQLRLKQQLSMAPQLQQAIRLLQLSRLELREHVQEILDSNPILERADDRTEAAPGSEDSAADLQDGEIDYSDPGSDFEDPPYDESEFSDAGLAEDWSSTDSYGTGGGDDAISLAQDTVSLQDHLLWQIDLAPLSPHDHAIATVIVHALDPDGYLRESVFEITALIGTEIDITEAQVEAVLRRVQRMEPVGVATRGPAECLQVQLQSLPQDTAGCESALRIVRHGLEALTAGNRAELIALVDGDEDALAEAIELIESLEPRPGTRFDNRRDEFIAPDVYVRRDNGDWRVSLSPDNRYDLRLNQYYIGLLKSAGKADRKYLSGRLQEARWLLSSIELRNRTLLGVTEAIVQAQTGFLKRGEVAMQPLVMSTIAEQVGVHESTVSRATSRKYVHTPRGLFELKYFFSSHVSNRQGQPVSATAVKARLARLLEQEDPQQPLSDQALTEALEALGLTIARRTVAKYRQALGLGSSAQRRRMARRRALRPSS